MDKNKELVSSTSSFTPDQEAIEQLKLKIEAQHQLSLINDTSTGNKTKKKKVLDEDVFTEKLASIIERDYYPDIKQIQYELEMETARRTGDYSKVMPLLQQLKSKQQPQPQDTPAYFESPLNPQPSTSAPQPQPSTSDIPVKELNEDQVGVEDMSLNTFLNRYTSEDTEAFVQLQEESYKRKMDKIQRLLTNGKTKEHNDKMEAALALPSIKKQALLKAGHEKDTSANKLVTWKYKDINEAMFAPPGAALTVAEKIAAKSSQVVVHENTRLQVDPFAVPKTSLLQRPASMAKGKMALKTMGKIGVDGKELTDSGTPAVNGFKILAASPQIAPEDLPCSPLMTWGEIEATPLWLREEGDQTPMLRRPNTGSQQFRMPEVSARDMMAQQLANQIKSKTLKHHNRPKSGAGHRQSGFDRLSSMSPAAQRFATNKLGLGNSVDRTLQASYTPRPSQTSSSRFTPTPQVGLVTPSPALSTRTDKHRLSGVVVTPKPRGAQPQN